MSFNNENNRKTDFRFWNFPIQIAKNNLKQHFVLTFYLTEKHTLDFHVVPEEFYKKQIVLKKFVKIP